MGTPRGTCQHGVTWVHEPPDYPLQSRLSVQDSLPICGRLSDAGGRTVKETVWGTVSSSRPRSVIRPSFYSAPGLGEMMPPFYAPCGDFFGYGG